MTTQQKLERILQSGNKRLVKAIKGYIGLWYTLLFDPELTGVLEAARKAAK